MLTFDELVEVLCEEIQNRLSKKGEHYAKGRDDRFHQFKQISSLTSLTPAQVCFVLMEKHHSLLADRVMSDDLTSDLLCETIPDILCYLFLLYGLIREHIWEALSCMEEKSRQQEAETSTS